MSFLVFRVSYICSCCLRCPSSLCCCCCYVASVVSNSVRPHRRQPTRLPRTWDSPGKNTAISFSNAWKWKVKVKLLSRVLTLSDPMDCSLPGSSVHGIFQARVLEWGAIAFSVFPLYSQLILLYLGASLNFLLESFQTPRLVQLSSCSSLCLENHNAYHDLL